MTGRDVLPLLHRTTSQALVELAGKLHVQGKSNREIARALANTPRSFKPMTNSGALTAWPAKSKMTILVSMLAGSTTPGKSAAIASAKARARR